MRLISLDANEVLFCQRLIKKLMREYDTADNLEFLDNAVLHFAELPERIKVGYRDLKYDFEDDGVMVISGFPVDDVGPTPTSWDFPESYHPNQPVDYLAVLFSTPLGDVFGWETQQKGKLIHDLIPIQGKGGAQTGYGSSSELAMHTEDSFHKYRGDYVCFYCVRNEGGVSTTFTSITDLVLSDEIKSILFEKRFLIRPDDSHLDQKQAAGNVTNEYLASLDNTDERIALLYGHYDNPFLCFDPAYMVAAKHDSDVEMALNALCDEVSAKSFEYALAPGDVCIIDNRRVVHGRKAFNASHDGSDRWLKRINITTSLRKSADSRVSPDSRLIGEPKILEEEGA